ncbi:MAG: bifunctional 2-keto-4-hydroxyglutarate aldolase/2-keto-3-deoxy-6-phosphogluconate aldolase [Bacillota bacterium]
MDKSSVIKKICDCGVVAVVRAENAKQAVKIADACVKAGIAGIEITFTVPGAVDVITGLSEVYKNGEILIGAGTVLDPETARAAILAGAKYIVSPCFNKEVVTLCSRYQIACMPGAMTIKEVVECMEAGADMVKIFPGELFGPAIIKAIKGPIPQAILMPTGGVSLENVEEWIKAGCAAVGVGGNLTSGAKKGDYQSITDIGKQFVEKVKEARVNMHCQ